jgi:hypothetical protein
VAANASWGYYEDEPNEYHGAALRSLRMLQAVRQSNGALLLADILAVVEAHFVIQSRMRCARYVTGPP